MTTYAAYLIFCLFAIGYGAPPSWMEFYQHVRHEIGKRQIRGVPRQLTDDIPPWLAIISQNGRQTCLGMLTKRNEIVTAAHCFWKPGCTGKWNCAATRPCQSVEGFTVYIPHTGARANVVKVLADANYAELPDGLYKSDIAFAQLSANVEGSDDAPQIAVGLKPPAHGNCRVIGKTGSANFIPTETDGVRVSPCKSGNQYDVDRNLRNWVCADYKGERGESGGLILCDISGTEQIVGMTMQLNPYQVDHNLIATNMMTNSYFGQWLYEATKRNCFTD